MIQESTPPRHRFAIACAALVFVNIGIYAQTLRYDYINLDDDRYITDNEVVKSGLSMPNVKWAFRFQESHWIPLTWLSYMAEISLFGPHPGVQHATNVLLHIANCLLLLWALERMTAAFWPSFVAAALFAVHPLRVESVAWITERKDVLSTLFGLLGIVAYAAYVKRPSFVRFLPVTLCFALGLMAKPMLVTFPFMLLLLDVWPLERLPLTREAWTRLRALLIEKLTLFPVLAASMYLQIRAWREGAAFRPLSEYSWTTRLANACVAYARYLGKTAWPRSLALFYPYRQPLPLWQVAGSIALLVAITAVAVWQFRKRPYGIVGWLWFVGTLVPAIGLVQAGSQSMADRFTYVPLIGLFAAFAWGLAELVDALRPFRWARLSCIGLTGALVMLLAFASWNQTRYWQNSITILEHSLAIEPDGAVSHHNLGEALVYSGRVPEAVPHFKRALALVPVRPSSDNSLGNAYFRLGRIDDAIVHFERAAKYDPYPVMPLQNLAVSYIAKRDYPKAIAAYERALKVAPRSGPTHFYLANAYRDIDDYERALIHYAEAIRSEPRAAEAYTNMGTIFYKIGRFKQAEEAYEGAIKAIPTHPEAHYNLGVMLLEQGKLDKAIEHFRAALMARPNYEDARHNLLLAIEQKRALGGR